MDSSTSTSLENSSRKAREGGPRLHGLMLTGVIAALMLTQLLEALDQTVVGTALPKIVGSLQGFDRYAWVVTAYLLASTTVVPIVGKLSDQFGRKWFFIVGVIIFLIGSFLAGAAQTMNQLIVFRAIQGLGTGIGIALVFTVIGDIFPPAQRVWWQGIFGAVYGFSSVIGPTVGGWLADHGPVLGSLITNQTRWRWVFYVNLPLGILALLALFLCLPHDLHRPTSRLTSWGEFRRIDFVGAFVAAIATISLLLGLTWWSQQNYSLISLQVIGALILAALLYLAFFFVERVAAEPILPFELFHNQIFAADSVLTFTSSIVLFGLTIYLPLFLQGVLNESATNSGIAMIPFTFSLVIGAACSGLVVAKLGRYHAITIIGSVLLVVGTFLLSRMTTTTSLFSAEVSMVLAGIGVGMFFSILTLVAQNALPHSRIGVGTGTITYLRAIGQTLGTAIVGAVINSTTTADITARLSAIGTGGLSAQVTRSVTDTQVLINSTYKEAVVKNVVHSAVVQAVHTATAAIPPGPQHDQQVLAVTLQVTGQVTEQTVAFLNQVFSTLRQSLSVGVTQGFATLLIFCMCILVAAVFLKDVPLAKEFTEDEAVPTYSETATEEKA